MRADVMCALFGATVFPCLPFAVAAQSAPGTAAAAEIASVLIPTASEDRDGPDVGIEGGGIATTCRFTFGEALIRVGAETGDAEKDSFGYGVERVECEPS